VTRSFVAILLPEDLRETIAAAVARLRPLGPMVAWVPERNLHITLQFLGDQSDEGLAAAGAALEDAGARSAPLDVALHGVGAFPGLERPRILWVGVAHGAPELRALQARVAAALAERGFPPDDRPWHAHLTIGRVPDERRWRREAGPPLRSALAQIASTRFGTLRVAEVALMRSDLSPSGARHTILRVAALWGA